MRLLMTGLLALGVAMSACTRSDSPSTANTPAPGNGFASGAAAPAATPSAAPAAKPETPAGDAVATAGREDVARTTAAKWREVTIPAGTSLPVVLDTAVASDTSHAEEAVQAHLSRAVAVHGETVLPEGSRVSGVVTDATRSGKVKGRAHIAVRFDTLTPRGEDERYRIRTSTVSRLAPATKKEDAMKIGAPAAGGAIIGAIVGGKKGALVGTAIGGGAGTAVVLSTRGKEVQLPKGAAFTLRLSEPLTVRIRG